MNHGVELLRQVRMEVVAQTLRLRPVDHADRPFQPRFLQQSCCLRRIPQKGEELGNSYIVKQSLVAFGKRRTYTFTFGRSVPIAGSGYGAGVRAEANQKSCFLMMFAG